MNTVSQSEQYTKDLSLRVGAYLAAAPSFLHTRSRNTDPDTSKEAAKAAVTMLASEQRLCIWLCVNGAPEGLTAREVAVLTGIDYIATQRRIAETGLTKTAEVRDGCRVWVA